MKNKWVIHLVLLSGWLAMSLVGQERRPPQSMNVLFLAIDDPNTWLLDDSNPYAGKVIAPNVRKLANSGVIFNRTYTASPACSPSRTAFLSGMSPWKTGIYENGMDIEASEPLTRATSFPDWFKQAGYYTASYGTIGTIVPVGMIVYRISVIRFLQVRLSRRLGKVSRIGALHTYRKRR